MPDGFAGLRGYRDTKAYNILQTHAQVHIQSICFSTAFFEDSFTDLVRYSTVSLFYVFYWIARFRNVTI